MEHDAYPTKPGGQVEQSAETAFLVAEDRNFAVVFLQQESQTVL